MTLTENEQEFIFKKLQIFHFSNIIIPIQLKIAKFSRHNKSESSLNVQKLLITNRMIKKKTYS